MLFNKMYNPYNPKNRLFAQSDIQAILSKHNCSLKVRNAQLFQTAMVHSSYVKRAEYTTPTGEPAELAQLPENCLELFDESYERLEHLGDSILGAVVSTYLNKRFPTENEGFMTDLKQELVCNEMLGNLSQKIGLDSFYIISRHNENVCNGRTNLKKLGDIMEAFLGAIWIDSDYNFHVISEFIVCLIERYVNIPKLLMNKRNYKEQLQKLYQSKFHYTPTYVVLSSSQGSYTMAAVDENKIHLGIGTASTKKQAEQLAAKEAVAKLS